MSVYIDNAFITVKGIGCFHMTADDEAELDAMASALGLDPVWKEWGSTGRPYFLVNRALRMDALDLGAIEVSRHRMAELSR